MTLTLEFNQLDDNFDYRLNKCWTLDSNNDGKIFLRCLHMMKHLILEVYLMGNNNDDHKGCPRFDWITTMDQSGFNVAQGFIRPNFISFPVFTFGNSDELVVKCEIYLCEEGSDSCNLDFTNCLQTVDGVPPVGRKRRSAATIGDGQNMPVLSVSYFENFIKVNLFLRI